MRLQALILSSALLIGAGELGAAEEVEPLENWWHRVNEVLDELAARYQVVPPTPVKVRWKSRHIWSGELSGPLLDMIAADLSDDGKSELVALTTREVVVLSRARGLFDIRTRQALPDSVASLRSRDPIGSLAVIRERDLPSLRARSSEQGAGGRYQMVDGSLVLVSEFAGYPVCGDGTIEAAPGRNYFEGKRITWPTEREHALGDAVYALRCSHKAVDPDGHPVEYMSESSSTGSLHLRCTGDAAHCGAMTRDYEDVGVAHAVADVDNDGYPEVIVSGAGAPGAPDRVTVYDQHEEPPRVVYDKGFRGGVVALAVGDFEGDGALEVVAAVRQSGTRRVTLWLLN